MISERKREANLLRAEGDEQAKEIRSAADRKSDIIVSEAEKEAETIRGTGDAKALKIYSEAYSKDPTFFEYWRTLESYKKSFEDGETSTIILSPKSRYMNLLSKGQLSAQSEGIVSESSETEKEEN